MNKFLINLPESLPICQDYSLDADMIYGWLPNIKYPTQLDFSNNTLDKLIQNIQRDSIVYLGPRYVDALELHSKYGQSYQYTINKQFRTNHEAIIKRQTKFRSAIQRPFKGMKVPHYLTFDSDFESGNLDLVIEISPTEYDLYMRSDSNLKGDSHWFYFTLLSEKDCIIKLNICNFSKSKCLYERGMRPYIKKGEQEWIQSGENIKFEIKPIRYDTFQSLRKFYRLSFEIRIKKNELTSFAYSIPYTYSKLLSYLKQFNPQSLTKSISGLDIPMITFGENNKRIIIITGRVHPGESNSSHVLEGLIDYLNSNEAAYLRKKAIIKVIPMLNVEGVIAGNFRTCVNGRDLNRQYLQPTEAESPSIYAVKELISKEKNIYMYIDIHGHSLKKNFFIYGPSYPIFSTNYLTCRLLAKIMSQQCEIFRYWSGLWRVSENKRSTARAALNQEFNIVHCFTLECSNGLYYLQSNQSNHEFREKDFNILGVELCKGIQQVLRLEIQHYKLSQQRHNKRKKKQSELWNLLKEIKQDEENHQVQDEDELIGSQSSESFDRTPIQQQQFGSKLRLPSKSSYTPKKIQPLSTKRKPKQSLLMQEIQCRKSFILEPKKKCEDKQEKLDMSSVRPCSAYNDFKRSVSTQRYQQSRLILLRQRMSFWQK